MKYVVTIDAGNGAFEMDYTGLSENTVRAAAEADWSEYSITEVKPA